MSEDSCIEFELYELGYSLPIAPAEYQEGVEAIHDHPGAK